MLAPALAKQLFDPLATHAFPDPVRHRQDESMRSEASRQTAWASQRPTRSAGSSPGSASSREHGHPPTASQSALSPFAAPIDMSAGHREADQGRVTCVSVAHKQVRRPDEGHLPTSWHSLVRRPADTKPIRSRPDMPTARPRRPRLGRPDRPRVRQSSRLASRGAE